MTCDGLAGGDLVHFQVNFPNSMSKAVSYTQNPSSSAYTQDWDLYTWDELITSISQVGKPLHEIEEDLSRMYLI